MASWFKKSLGSQEAQARTAGVFAAACAVGMLINLIALLLGAINFAPLQAVVAADEQLFFSLATPPISNPETLHRVVLVDIDDDKVGPDNIQNGGSTPRAIIADLIDQIRKQGPTAIFVDIDLRNGLGDDQTLRTELARPGQPPVLIPYFLEGAPAACGGQDKVEMDRRPILLGSPFCKTSDPKSVLEVHGLMETGAYGLVEGTCSAFLLKPGADGRTQIPAAMVEAARLAGARGLPAEPRLVHALWRIRDRQEPAGGPRNPRLGPGGQALYTWIPAGDLSLARRDLFKSAIVIIGASQTGSDDIHDTPVGPMIGSLIQVNLAIDLQQQREGLFSTRSTIWQVLFDAVLTILTGAAVALTWHPLHRKLGRHETPTAGQKGWRLVFELGVVLLIFLVVAGATLLGARLWGGGLALWRFTFVSSLLGSAFIVMMEATFLLGEVTKDAVEWAVRHHGRLFKRHRRKP